MNIFELFEEQQPLTLIDALRDFLPIAIAHLELDHIPKIKLVKSLDDTTFGHFNSKERIIYAVVANRNPVDILRTIAHEMVHYKQGEEHRLDQDSGNTGSPIEDEANAEGGVIMRLFNQAHPNYMLTDPIEVAESTIIEKRKRKKKTKFGGYSGYYGYYWGGSDNDGGGDGGGESVAEGGPITEQLEQLEENQEKYIIYLNNKPVSTYPTNREAEYQAKLIAQKFPTVKIDIKKEVCTLSPVQLKENLQSIKEGKHCDAKNAVPELKSALTNRKTELKNADAKVAYDKIDKIMTRIATTYNISGQKLHDLWVERYGEVPDTWVLDEAQHTEIIKHSVGNWIVYLDNHLMMRSITREIGPRLMSNLITAVAMIPDLENKVLIGGQFWIQDIKTNSSLYFKRLNVPGEPLAVRCETGVQDVPRASKQTPVFRVNAYTGPEKPQDVQHMKRAKHISRFVGGNTMAANIARKIQKAPWTGDAGKEVITNPATQDSKRYDRAFNQAQQLKKKGEVEENFADGRGPGKPGDSQRHGIPKGATMAELKKASHVEGRKGQLARWQLNMRRGHKK